MNLINRNQYTDKIVPFIKTGMIVVLTGQRRVGKSCILLQLKSLYENSANSNVIYINKENVAFDNIRSYTELSEYVNRHYASDKDNYLFIDEIQEISEFERALRSFQLEEKFKIVVTGSNAKMLSGELSTILAGRYIEFHIQGLSYNEFIEFHGLSDSDETLMSYLNYGGLPQLHRLGLENNDLIIDYLRNISNTIILKDVVAREQIRNISSLQNLIAFIADNIGKLVSASSISKYMKTQQMDVTTTVVLNYLSFFCNAFIINKIPRYDIHGKRLLESNDKYYFEDLGLRNILVGNNRVGDIEKLMENVIYLHLKNQGFTIAVGQFRQTEIDFVVQKNGQTMYFQATYLLASEETINREFGNLQLIHDNYPKYVVSLDDFNQDVTKEGIIHLNMRKFLQMSF